MEYSRKTALQDYLEDKSARLNRNLENLRNNDSTQLALINRRATRARNRYLTATATATATNPSSWNISTRFDSTHRQAGNNSPWRKLNFSQQNFLSTPVENCPELILPEGYVILSDICDYIADFCVQEINQILSLTSCIPDVVHCTASSSVLIIQKSELCFAEVVAVNLRVQAVSATYIDFVSSLENSWENCSDGDEESDQDDWYYEEYDIKDVVPSIPERSLQDPWSNIPIRFNLPEDTLDSGRKLDLLCSALKHKESNLLMSLEERYSSSRAAKKLACLKPTVVKAYGEKDKQGRLVGEGELWYSNGSRFRGHFSSGVKDGFGVLEMKNGDFLQGFYSRDKLNGWCEQVYQEYGWIQKYYRNDLECGLYRNISPAGDSIEFGLIGHNKVWRFLEGGCAIFGNINKEGEFDGTKIIYIYPGFRLCICGQFSNGKLKSGTEELLTQLRCDEYGFPVPETTRLGNSRNLVFESPGTHCPARHLHLRDLLDILNVYVMESSVPLAGDGLFAKRAIKKGEVVVIFNGARKRKILRVRESMEEFSDYCIRVDDSLSLDIPEAYIPVQQYSATLAHKACHSFTPNSEFCNLYHPRFGRIMCIKAVRDLVCDEEIFVSYNYAMDRAPDWYSNLWFNHLRNLGWPEESVQRLGLVAAGCSRIFKNLNSKIQREAKLMG